MFHIFFKYVENVLIKPSGLICILYVTDLPEKIAARSKSLTVISSEDGVFGTYGKCRKIWCCTQELLGCLSIICLFGIAFSQSPISLNVLPWYWYRLCFCVNYILLGPMGNILTKSKQGTWPCCLLRLARPEEGTVPWDLCLQSSRHLRGSNVSSLTPLHPWLHCFQSDTHSTL